MGEFDGGSDVVGNGIWVWVREREIERRREDGNCREQWEEEDNVEVGFHWGRAMSKMERRYVFVTTDF